jgi:hypothetical protein
MIRELALPLLLAMGVSAAACGSSSSTGSTGGTGGSSSGGSNTGGTSSGGSAGAGGVAGSGGVPDAGSDASDGGPFVADAGMFDCQGCGCNGATHYCVNIMAGTQVMEPFGTGECTDVTDPTAEGCHPLPADCKGVPSCGCLPSPLPGAGGACDCGDSGGGLTYSCALP